MKKREIKYFRVITQTTGFEYLVEMANSGDHYWNYLYQSDSRDNVIAKISDYVMENNVDCRLMGDSSTSNFIIDVQKEIIRKRKMQQNNEHYYTLMLKLYNLEANDSRVIEIEGLKGEIRDLKFEVIGFVSENKESELMIDRIIDFEIDYKENKYIVFDKTFNLLLGECDELWEAHYCIAKEIKDRNINNRYRVFRVENKIKTQIKFDPDFVISTCEEDIKFVDEDDDSDDCCSEIVNLKWNQEITKDLMLDEVISSQKLEISRLLKIIEDQQSYIMTLNENSSHMSKELMSVFQKVVQNKK